MAPRKVLLVAFLGLGALFGFTHALHGGHHFGPGGRCHGSVDDYGERHEGSRHRQEAPPRREIHHHYYD